MSRSYYVNGPCMVSVDGEQLGLSDQQIRVVLNFHHEDVPADDFGTEVPPEILYWLTDAFIEMTLVHFDSEVANDAITSAMGGGTLGEMQGAGSPLGVSDGGSTSYSELALSSQQQTWTFPAAYCRNSVEYPIGTERSVLRMSWRAIPSSSGGGSLPSTDPIDPKSSGRILWTF